MDEAKPYAKPCLGRAILPGGLGRTTGAVRALRIGDSARGRQDRPLKAPEAAISLWMHQASSLPPEKPLIQPPVVWAPFSGREHSSAFVPGGPAPASEGARAKGPAGLKGQQSIEKTPVSSMQAGRRLVETMGFEPTTFALRTRHSPN